jgi:iron complex outermembrane receptor protein
MLSSRTVGLPTTILCAALLAGFVPGGAMSAEPDVLLPAPGATEAAADSQAIGDSQASDAAPAGDESLDEFDALLNLAEEDVSKLTTVKVVAPAFEEVVTTVSRRKSTVGKSPAAVFVITNEMIRRSGARSLPEVLRMAPGVHVSRINGAKWAIGMRGFTGRFTNNLLVQIDGRSVYTPLFAGVFWDSQNVLMEDIERIEVVRGPGATVWGANAVNGVINVITKKAEDTQGTFVEAGGGSERAFGSARIGTQLGDNAWVRFYGKWYERDTGGASTQGGLSGFDDSRMKQGGFRLDWTPDSDTRLTVQGDIYTGASGDVEMITGPPPDILEEETHDILPRGGNVIARLSQTTAEDAGWDLQFYFDHIERIETSEPQTTRRNVFDIDFQHHFQPLDGHNVVWGTGYRLHHDRLDTSPAFYFSYDDGNRRYDIFSTFLQDEITLIEDKLKLTLGSKLSHNDFTGWEIQPSSRLLWMPSETQAVWGAVSRAVRTPSRIEDDGRYPVAAFPTGPPPAPPGYLVQIGNPYLQSENLMAYELGYREQVTEEFAWDMALFYHDYEDSVAATLQPPVFGPEPGLVFNNLFANDGSADTYGLELSGSWQAAENWRLFGSYTFLRAFADVSNTPTDARNMFYVQSSWNVTEELNFDTILRYVDNQHQAPSYLTMDLRLAWLPTENLEMFVVGRNLLDNEHPELVSDYIAQTPGTGVESEVYGGLTLRY